MSGLVKGIKKVFKKIGKFVKKYWKYIVIAVAVYFTAGVALSYFGGTAGFASAMPGFGTGGLFSKAAVAIGFKGSATVASGLSMTSGAWAGAAGAAYGSTLTAAELAAAQGVSAGMGAGAAGEAAILAPAKTTAVQTTVGGPSIATASTGGTGVTGGVATNAAAIDAAAAAGSNVLGGVGGMSATDAAMKAMSGAMKMQAASTLLKTAGGLLAPDEDELDEKAHARRNQQAFGVGRDGDATWGWNTPLPEATQGSAYAQQPSHSTSGSGGSMYATQTTGGNEFLAAPQGSPTQQAQGAAPQGDFIVQPRPAGG